MNSGENILDKDVYHNMVFMFSTFPEVSDRPFEQLSGETIKAVNDDVQEDEDTEPMELDDSSIRRGEYTNTFQ